jgi:hypothetical protein
MPEAHIVHITTSVRGDDNRLMCYNCEFEDEGAADAFMNELFEAAASNRLIKVADDPRLKQASWLNAANVLEVRRRRTQGGQVR